MGTIWDTTITNIVNGIKALINNHNTNSNSHSSLFDEKVNVSDIKDNLTSMDTNKPLSAKQGKELKTLVDGKSDDGHTHTISNITDFPSTMTPSSHTHNTGEVTDTSAYTNIGSASNSTQKCINEKINTALGNKANSSNVYSKSETYTQSEVTSLISNAVSNLQLFEVVNALPTSNIKDNRLYLIVNGEAITNNSYDIYLRVDNQWEQLDSLEFDISNFYNKTETNALLNGKVDTTDSRLTNARTPLTHNHGNLQNDGSIGTTDNASKNVVTDSNGKITTEEKPTIPTKTSDLINDNGYLTTHQDISGKVNITDIKDNLTSTDTNKPLSAKQGKWLNENKADLNHTHSQYLTSHQDISGKLNITDFSTELEEVIDSLITEAQS